MKPDDRHKRVVEQLLIHGRLSFEELQKKAQMRRSDDEFGLIMGDLAKWGVVQVQNSETRYYSIRPEVVTRAKDAA